MTCNYPCLQAGGFISAVLVYEYIITFDQERLAIWKRKYTFATWLFVANRYLAILYGIMLLLSDQVTGQLVSEPPPYQSPTHFARGKLVL